jgi:hypothetical protein
MDSRRELYDFFSAQNNLGLSFSCLMEGKNPGPSILFFLAVDGRELSTVKTAIQIYKDWREGNFFLKKGRAYFVLANPEAFLANQKFLEEDLNNAFYYRPNNTLEGRRVLEIRNFLKQNTEISHIYRLYGGIDSKDQEIIHFTFRQDEAKQLKINPNKAEFRHIDGPKKVKLVNLKKEKEHKESQYSSLFQEIENFKAEYLEVQLGKDQKKETETKLVEKYEAILDYHLNIVYKSRLIKLFFIFLFLLLLLLLLLLCLIFDCFFIKNLYLPVVNQPEQRLGLVRFELPNFPLRIPSIVNVDLSWSVKQNFFTDSSFSLNYYEGKVYFTVTNIDGRLKTAFIDIDTFLQNSDNLTFIDENENQQEILFTNSPAAIFFQNKLYQSGIAKNNQKIYTRFLNPDDNNFTNWQEDEQDFSSNKKTEFLEFQDKLWQIAISNQDNQIYLRSLNKNQDWTDWQKTNTPKLLENSTTSSIVFENQIRQIILSDENKVLERVSEDGINWSEWQVISSTLEPTQNVIFSSVEDNLYQFYISDRGVLYERFFDSEEKTWLQWEQKSEATSFKKASGISKIRDSFYQTVVGKDLQIYFRKVIKN